MGVKETPKFSGLSKNRNFLLSHMTVQRELVQADKGVSGSSYFVLLPYMLSIPKVTSLSKMAVEKASILSTFQPEGRKKG